MQEYEVTNWHNSHSEQLYPIRVVKVEYVNFVSKKYPNGYLQVSCDSVDGHHASMLKCYQSKKGRYAIWGKRRIYEGYKGPVRLIGVPSDMLDAVKQFCEVG